VFDTVTPGPPGLGSNATVGPSPAEGKSAAATAAEPAASASVVGLDHGPGQNLPHLVINGEGLGIQFETDSATGTTVIRVVDLESGAVVRQIPSEEVLNFLRQFESVKGKLFSRML
jgi:hypothetical protein